MNKRVKSNSIRIIAGQWRGRKLNVIDADGLRPTTDRVRETLFNWLMYDVQGARCLDLFAGTGVLGMELLSRGARFVQFVESNKRAAASLQQEFEHFKLSDDQADIMTIKAQQFLLTTPEQPFDVVLLDPPYADNLLPSVIAQLAKPGWLSKDAFVYVEQASKETPVSVPAGWHLYRENQAGQSQYRLYSLNSGE